jgi:Lipopolysaccharide assembly protein A domain
MKAFRIIQIILLVAIAGYLFWFNSFNNWIELPLLISLPAGLVVGIGIGLGWLIGWLSGRSALWGKGREIKKLNKRIVELENQTPSIRASRVTEESGAPIIPDRSGTFQSDSEFENI